MRQVDQTPITSSPCSIEWPALLLPLRLEVRRIDNDLCIRVLPDQPFVNAHKELLSGEEVAAGLRLWDIVSADDWERDETAIARARDEWAELARRYGPNRAAWILESFVTAGGATDATSEVAAVPTLFLLPERFVFLVYENDELVYQATGPDLRGPYTLLPAPTDDDSPPTDGLFDEQSKWVASFDSAATEGLGIRIPLFPEHVAATELHFSEIVVLGLDAGGEAVGAQAFQQLVQTHRYTDGFEFLLYGTPTNNTGQGPSGFSESTDELVASFDVEVHAQTLSDDSAAEALNTALGLSDRNVFAHIKGANLSPHQPFRMLVNAVWPSTGDYFFSQLLGYAQFADDRTRLEQYVEQYLRPGGHFAALRVGNLPYGVLPASRIRPASSADTTGWKQSPIDHASGAVAVREWFNFDSAILKTLGLFLPLWLDRAADRSVVSRAGSSSDPDDELIRLLGMSPHSIDYRVRPLIDQTLIFVLYVLFQYRSFGINSSFEGLADPQAAAGSWAYTWQEFVQQRREFFEALGVSPQLKNQPPLLRLLAWGTGFPLGMELVRVPMPPLVEPLPDTIPPPDGPETYLPLFVAGQPLPASTGSNTLLFELLRRSLTREPDLPTSMRTVWPAVIGLAEYPILEFFNNTGTGPAVDAITAREPRIANPSAAATALRDRPPGGYSSVQAILAKVSSENPQFDFEELSKRLQYDFSARIESSLRDLIDAQTSRLDAWFTSLAARRLTGMRAAQAHPTGLHWGAYGYLEDITLRKHSLNVVEEDPGSGYVHAPTIGQASAAAVLRSAYAAHRNDENGNAYAVNLTSRRVNRALRLIDGVRQGNDLASLHGFAFERSLHDAGLDRAIDAFRTAFPYSSPDPADMSDAAESVGTRDVCDGHALATAEPTDSRIAQALDGLRIDDQAQFARDRAEARELLQDLRDSNDAVGDLLLFEGIYQAVQGNVERSGAALDACAGLGKPPEIESVATPSTGPTLRHRVCLFVPWFDTPSQAGARAVAEPSLSEWATTIIGALANIGCIARFTPDDGGQPEDSLSLSELQPAISALDFVYMCATLPDGTGSTEIEARLRRALRGKRIVASDSDITLALDEAPSGLVSLSHAMELGRAFLDLLGDATNVTASTVTHPDYAPTTASYPPDVAGKLIDRAQQANTDLNPQIADLSSSTTSTVLAALDMCAGYGIAEAVVERADDPAIAERGRRVLAIVTKRREAAAASIAATESTPEHPVSDDTKVQSAIAALKALFGDSFLVLPACDASGIDPDHRADFAADLPPRPPEDRVWLWFQQVAETHPRVRRFETFLIAAEAWGYVPSLELAQLPRQTDLAWQALADDEMITKGRIRGVQSIVAVKPATLDVTRLSGFVVDEWTEAMPSSSIPTGVSFEYNQPASQAPQCFLIAAPGNFDEPVWTTEHLAGIVRDTMSLAKVRLVDLDALPNVAGLAPALVLPITNATIHVNPGIMGMVDVNP